MMMRTYPEEIALARKTDWLIDGDRLVTGQIRGQWWWSNGFIASVGRPPLEAKAWQKVDKEFEFEKRLFKDGVYKVLYPLGLYACYLPQPVLVLASNDGELVIPVQVGFYHHFHEGWGSDLVLLSLINNNDRVVEAWANGMTVGFIMPLLVGDWLGLSGKFGVNYHVRQ